MKVIIQDNPLEIVQLVALRAKVLAAKKKNIVLGIAAGSTQVHLYREFVKMVENSVPKSNRANDFNSDKGAGRNRNAYESHTSYMKRMFFDLIDVDKSNTHIASSTEEGDLMQAGLESERDFYTRGRIDLQVVGIGRNGHIGYNEPPFEFSSLTQAVTPSQATILDNTLYLEAQESQPRRSIKMGIETILSAKEIVCIASGENKAEVIRDAINGPITQRCPASVLQKRGNVTFILDSGAASMLESVEVKRTPRMETAIM